MLTSPALLTFLNHAPFPAPVLYDPKAPPIFPAASSYVGFEERFQKQPRNFLQILSLLSPLHTLRIVTRRGPFSGSLAIPRKGAQAEMLNSF